MTAIAGRHWRDASGTPQVDTSLDVVELAAYTGVANVVLNLDETLTKE